MDHGRDPGPGTAAAQGHGRAAGGDLGPGPERVAGRPDRADRGVRLDRRGDRAHAGAVRREVRARRPAAQTRRDDHGRPARRPAQVRHRDPAGPGHPGHHRAGGRPLPRPVARRRPAGQRGPRLDRRHQRAARRAHVRAAARRARRHRPRAADRRSSALVRARLAAHAPRGGRDDHGRLPRHGPGQRSAGPVRRGRAAAPRRRRPGLLGGTVSSLLEVSAGVSEALAAGAPVVALESTIISHGLPRPGNLDAARQFEAILAEAGVTAATIALIDGVAKIGLSPADLERIASDESVVKVSSRDIGIAMARKMTGGTTVAATSVLAARAGIGVFATGGLGGVHRGAAESFDESADLTVLSRTPITVVSAGVKSILDIPATLERLETLSVAVIGYRTLRFPAFWLSDSGYDLDWRADSPEEIADIMAARAAFGDQSALLVANPVPADLQLDPGVLDGALTDALAVAADQGVRGKAVSPFLLDRIQQVTGGMSVGLNLHIARGNIELAAKISRAWAMRTAGPS